MQAFKDAVSRTLFAEEGPPKVKLIIDTDLGYDVEDVGALAVAHNLADQGKVDILATIHSTGFNKGIAAVNVINTYYGRPDTRLGAYKGPFGADWGKQNDYANTLVQRFPNGDIWSSDDVPDAMQTYVDVLKKQADNSVVIAAIGFPMNIRNVLRNYPDLFEQKVKEVHWMSSWYNFNCGNGQMAGDTTDCDGSAKEVQERIPDSVKQYQQVNGADMCIGADLYNDKCSNKDNPVKRAYHDWMMRNMGMCWPGRPSQDPLTVYAAIVGAGDANMYGSPGSEIALDGAQTFASQDHSENLVSLGFRTEGKQQGIIDIFNEMLCAGKPKPEILQ